MHRHHEPTTLRSRDFGLVHRNRRNERSNAETVDDTTSEEHAVVNTPCAYGGANDEYNSSALNRPFPRKLVCSIPCYDTADGRSGRIDTVESSDELCSATVAYFALRREAERFVEGRLADGGAGLVSVERAHGLLTMYSIPNDGHAIRASCAAESDIDDNE